jgi:hypothetical protein
LWFDLAAKIFWESSINRNLNRSGLKRDFF